MKRTLRQCQSSWARNGGLRAWRQLAEEADEILATLMPMPDEIEEEIENWREKFETMQRINP